MTCAILIEPPCCSRPQPPVTYFVLQVRLGTSTYHVRRRFKDFDTLYHALCHAHGKHAVPQLPPKQVIKNETADFLRERKTLLSDFLTSVFADKVISMAPELCAFLECEAGATLATANADLASCTGMLVAEVSAAEALASANADALDAANADIEHLRQALTEETNLREEATRATAATVLERDAARSATAAAETAANANAVALAAAEKEIDGLHKALARETAAKEAALAEVQKPNAVGDALSAALSAAIQAVNTSPSKMDPAETVEPASPAPTELIESATNASAAEAGAAVAPAAVPSAAPPVDSWQMGVDDAPEMAADAAAEEAPTTPRAGWHAPMAPVAAAPVVPSQPDRPFWAAKRPSGAVLPPEALPAPPVEHALKCGLLMKQGAGNKAYQERYFELVSLGEHGAYGAFLVYYDSELKQSVKGYISLEGASVIAGGHKEAKDGDAHAEPYAFTLTTPARRLSMLTPGLAPGPLKMGLKGPLASRDCPPSLDARMNILEKLDNWGKHALRNMLADGPLDKPVTSWSLAAHSPTELAAWLRAFGQLLGESKIGSPASDTSTPEQAVGANGYARIGEHHHHQRLSSMAPLNLVTAEEVM